MTTFKNYFFSSLSVTSILPANIDNTNIMPGKSKLRDSFFGFGFKAGLFSCLGINIAETIFRLKYCTSYWADPDLLIYGFFSGSFFTIMKTIESLHEDGTSLSKALKSCFFGILGSFFSVWTFEICANISLMMSVSQPVALVALPPLLVGLIYDYLPRLEIDINAHRGILVDLGFFKRKCEK